MNVWNPNTTVSGVPGITGMVQVSQAILATAVCNCYFSKPRFANGEYNDTDPRHCSVNDPTHSTCFLNAVHRDGFYEGQSTLDNT